MRFGVSACNNQIEVDLKEIETKNYFAKGHPVVRVSKDLNLKTDLK